MGRWNTTVAAALAAAGAALAMPVAAAADPPGDLPQERGGVRPGPDVLYAPQRKAPQFANRGVWKAQPTRICNTSAYRKGEFVYQDCLLDDHGGGIAYDWPQYTYLKNYTYPTAPGYRGNAADLVDVRVKPLEDATAFRISFNTMKQRDLVATTLALGDSASPREVPHGANTVMPAQLFVTAHGDDGDIVDAATGKALDAKPTVRTSLARRQVEVRVPYAVWDPRGKTDVRLGAAAGLWNAEAGRYLVPEALSTATAAGGALPTDPTPSAFFNAAFRTDEPLSPWRDRQQLAAIGEGDLSPFHADVDFTKLAARTTDNSGVPRTGYLQRIYVSAFAPDQGLRQPGDPNGPPLLTGTQQNAGQPGLNSSAPGTKDFSLAFGWPCTDDCTPDMAGNLQKYTAYVPERRPSKGYGMLTFTPGYAITPNDSVYGKPDLYQAVGDRPGLETIVAMVDGRGNDNWYYGSGGASVFEAWADLARQYRLDAKRSTMAGFSSGGYGANKLSLQFPDVFGKAFICDGLDRAPSFPGINGVADTAPVDTVTKHKDGSDITPLLASRYNQPVMEWAGVNDDFIPYNITRRRANAYAAGAYDYEFVSWTGLAAEHLQMCNNGTFDVLNRWLGASRRAVDPPRVKYVRNPTMDDPGTGMVGDHAYWLSDVQTRGESPLTGTIDVTTKGRGITDKADLAPEGKPIGADPAGTLIDSVPDPAGLLKQIQSGTPPQDRPELAQQLTAEGTTVESTPSDGFPIGAPAARTALPANPYLRERRKPATPQRVPAQDVLVVDATNIGSVTIDRRRAKVSCGADLQVRTDGPLEVRLTGCPVRRFG